MSSPYRLPDMQANEAAMLLSPASPLVVQTRPVTAPKAGQLLLKTKAVAVNPSDWKMQDTKDHLPCVLGSDVAGIVEAVGPDSEDTYPHSYRPGDRMAAFAGGAWSNCADEAAFQSYVLVSASSALRIPENMSFEQAATLPMATATAAGALWKTLDLPRPTIEDLQAGYSTPFFSENLGILIFGASSAVGLMAVQMASKMGLVVFAVASKRHREYIESLGARYFFDREADDLLSQVAEAISGADLSSPLLLGVDAISDGNTIAKTVAILERCASGGEARTARSVPDKTAKLAITLDRPPSLPTSDLVTAERTSASHFHIDERNASWLFNQYIPQMLAATSLEPAPPVRLVAGGLAGLNEALDTCRRGVSCQKLVLQL